MERGKIMSTPNDRPALRPAQALALPLTFTLMLVAFALLPAARQNPTLIWTFVGVATGLLVWYAILLATALGRGRTFTLEVDLRPQHYLQACAHLALYVYWGWYWREVYHAADFIVAQLVFAYAFGMLLTWSRRDTFMLGFGPFPIIFSINLFLWFKPDWFFLQFLLVAVGLAAKELLRWNKEGKQVHIFNPSSFPLTLCSIVLILTGTTHITWGPDIAFTQHYPPHIYLLIFLVSLPAQFLWGIVSMTMSAVVTAYTLGLLYLTVTGNDFFFGSYIPVAIFLGMHLLVTDPSTSPRTELGRIIFGFLYGLSTVAIFGMLGHTGTPTFYDKLLAVPVLNLMIQGIDRAARWKALRRFDPAALGRNLTPKTRNLVYMSVWTVIFVIMQIQTGTTQNLARRNTIGAELLVQGQTKEAIAHFRQLVRDEPDDVAGHINLAGALLKAGRPRDAEGSLRGALQLQPDHPTAHYRLALALCTTAQPNEGIRHFREAIRLRPDWPLPLRDLAWLRASHPDAALRNPAEAIRLASHAARLRESRDPSVRASILDTLAVAYAAAGRFEEAIHTAEAAETLLAPEKAAQVSARLNLYRGGQPFISGSN